MKQFNACSCCLEPIKYGQEFPYAGQVANMGQACWEAGFQGVLNVGWEQSGRNGQRPQTPDELRLKLYDLECELIYVGSVGVAPGSTQVRPNLFPVIADWIADGGKMVLSGDFYTQGGNDNFPTWPQTIYGLSYSLIPYNTTVNHYEDRTLTVGDSLSDKGDWEVEGAWFNQYGFVGYSGDWYSIASLGSTYTQAHYDGYLRNFRQPIYDYHPRTYGNGKQSRLDTQNYLLEAVGSSIHFTEDCIDLPTYNPRGTNGPNYTVAYPDINRDIYCLSDCKDKSFINLGACQVDGGMSMLTSSEGKSIAALEKIGKGWVLAFGCRAQVFGYGGQWTIENADPKASHCCFWERFLNNEVLYSED